MHLILYIKMSGFSVWWFGCPANVREMTECLLLTQQHHWFSKHYSSWQCVYFPKERRMYNSKNNNYYVEINCQLDATEVFTSDLIACSTCFGHHYAHHQELKSIIQWLLPVVLFKLLVWCGAEGYAAASCKPDT